jgi:hypothetical protein
MRTYGAVEVWLYHSSLLYLTEVSGCLHALATLSHEGKNPRFPLMDLKAGLDAARGEKSHASAGNRTPAFQHIARHYTD